MQKIKRMAFWCVQPIALTGYICGKLNVRTKRPKLCGIALNHTKDVTKATLDALVKKRGGIVEKGFFHLFFLFYFFTREQINKKETFSIVG